MAPEATTTANAPHQNEVAQEQNKLQQESKSARKKRLQREKQASVDSSKTTSTNSPADSNPAVANVDAPASAPQEPAIIKELQKQLRNVTKKLNGMAKLDATVAEHPDKSLDELVDQKLINLDQKAQALKKPSLQAAAAQIEEQIGHFRSYAAYYEALIEKQKSDARESLNKELEKVRNEVETATRDKCEQEFTARLLTLSQFLCAAARMRQVGEAASNESRAFEGVLLQVYSGTDDAVKSMMKLINGVDENVRSVEGDEVEITYGFVKSASAEAAPVPQVYSEVQGTTVIEIDADSAAANGVTQTTTTVTTDEVITTASAGVEPETPTASAELAAAAAPSTAVEETTVTAPETATETTAAEISTVEATTQEAASTEATTTVPAGDAGPVESTDNATASAAPSQPRAHNNRGRGNFRGNRGGFFRGRGGNFRGGERGRGRGSFRGNRGRGGYHQQRDSNGQPQQQQQQQQAPAQLATQ